jgi:valyl-tRNA synthetase
MEALIDAVRAIRNLRAEKKIDPARWVEALIGAESEALRHAFSARAAVAETLARARPLLIVHPGELPTANVVRTVLEWGSVVLPLAGLVDVEAERARLRKELAAEEANVARIEAQLPKMRGRAPEPVIAKMEEGLAASRAKLTALRASLDALEP